MKIAGHGIPDKDVEKRFGESLRNLHKIIDLWDLAALYDNTDEFRRFAKPYNLIPVPRKRWS